MIDIFAWIVFITMVASLVFIFAWLGILPGKVARKRNHPYIDAITVGSWVTIIGGGVLWPFILIWAYATPTPSDTQGDAK